MRATNLRCKYQLRGLGPARLQGPPRSPVPRSDWTSSLSLSPRLLHLSITLLVPHPTFALPLFSDVTPGTLSRPIPQAPHQSLQFLIGQQREERREGAFYFAPYTLPSSFLVFKGCQESNYCLELLRRRANVLSGGGALPLPSKKINCTVVTQAALSSPYSLTIGCDQSPSYNHAPFFCLTSQFQTPSRRPCLTAFLPLSHGIG